MNRVVLRTYLAELELNRDAADPLGPTLCAACVNLVGVSGAGITLIVDGVQQGSLCVSDETTRVIEDLQFTLGEGPCLDAYRGQRPVSEPDLAEPRLVRWPAFAGPALAAGVRAVFGFPLKVGAARLGALDLYRDEPGDLRDEQFRDALELADLVAQTILGLQAGAAPATLAVELEHAQTLRAVVHQASGVLAARHDISVTDALVRLRAYAFVSERAINDVADDVVAGRLRLE